MLSRMAAHAPALMAFTALTLALFTPARAADDGSLAITVHPYGPRSLTVPDTAAATVQMRQIPGAVNVVPDTQFRNTPARTYQDMLGRVPGVITHTRFGPDGRLSIRGSGLSRNYTNRGINMFMDGIPINTADGPFDLFEADPARTGMSRFIKGPMPCVMVRTR